MTKFTHPQDAPEGHKWTYEGHPVLAIFEGVEDMLAVYQGNDKPGSIYINKGGYARFGDRVIDAPREHTLWFNVYERNGCVHTSTSCETRKEADGCALRSRIACVPLTFKDGEGL